MSTHPLRRKAIELAVIGELRDGGPTSWTAKSLRPLVERHIAGDCTAAELGDVIQALRYQGKLKWDRLALADSMKTAGNRSATPIAEEDAAHSAAVASHQPGAATSAPGPDDDDSYPGEVNDVAEDIEPPAARPRSKFDADLRKAGIHASATRAGARPPPAPEHEPEIARQAREQATETVARRALAFSTGTVRQPLELRKFALPDMSTGEGVASLVAQDPSDLMLACSRKHPALWRRVLLLGRRGDLRPGAAFFAALERGLDELEAAMPPHITEDANAA